MASVLMRGKTTQYTKCHGIEVNEYVTWQGWEPGGEYTKNIILKNVQVKTQKLKYKGPSTRFFTTLYPKPIVLSSGTSFTLPVTFRPLEKDQYEDYIEFQTNEGEFKIPMKAVLPIPDISVPESLNFNMCAVKDSVHLSFEVRNTSELMTTFQWDLTAPFTFTPPSGTLAPGTSCLIKATFTPKEAKVYEAIAVCKYSHNPDNVLVKSTKIEGIGKFPHLVVRTGAQKVLAPEQPFGQADIDFGDVPLQTTKTKTIELLNTSPVNAPFQVIQPSSAANMDTVFSCSQYHGIVAAESSVRLKISYSPHTPNQKSVDYFEVVALGATNCSMVKCFGTGKGPYITLDSTCLDFTVVESGKQIARTFKIINSSSVPAAFQFLIDCSQSVFKLNTICGLIPGGETHTIIMYFTPTEPINYYRRLVCLVQNQDPLFLDLIGTCHTEQVKPAPLRRKHLDRYHTHVSRGLSRIPPEQLNNMLLEKKLQLDEQGAVMPVEGVSLGESCISLPQLSPLEELFNDSSQTETTLVVPHVSLDIRSMDFGRILDDKAVVQKTVNITNHTKGKITCSWMKDTKGIFSVSPVECDLLPLKTASFRVTFRPNAANQFFSAELECYATYKSMRDYRLVEDNTLCPPWCLRLNTSGHTFAMGTETFIPRFEWDASKMVFPAVTTGQMSYRTLLLSNNGANPIRFAFEPDPDRLFTCIPSQGLLTDKYQLFVFRMSPPEPQIYKRTVKCCFNDTDKFTQELALVGSAETPHVQLEGEGTVYFKPTCIGTTSTRSITVKNTSRIPLCFRWKVAGAFEKAMSIEPANGIIMPNEAKIELLSFSPAEATKYLIKAKLFVSSWQGDDQTSPSSDERKYLVRVIGEGSVGELLCVEPSIDFGDIIVGSMSSRDITIHNNSDCSLHYRLTIDQDVQGPYDDEGAVRDVMSMELSKSDGVIAARTSVKITATVFPARRVTYNHTINYELLSTTEGGKNLLTRSQTPLVQLRSQGVYPTLSVNDIRGLGSNKGCSKVQMWSLFCLDSLNECLDSDPSPPELMYVAATRHSTKRRVPVYTRAIMDFNFGAAPLDSEPATVHLNLENTGSVDAEWAFLYPSDLQLELEYWSETGEYDADELHEMQVMDNKLFSVEPRKGTLSPGSKQTISLTYRHLYTGVNKLPVIFKVMRGREILLNFIGVTVDPDAYYVHFASTKHMFEPVPVGGNSPPVQIYELHNGGAKSVNYELDIEPLGQMQAQNYGCTVLDCLNPTGEIPPGCTALIHWVFAPLEAKTYVVDIPIRIIGGDTVLVTFTGVGYDQRIMGDTMAFKDNALATVPSKQLVNVKEQLSYLSVERLAFDNIPLYSMSRKVFFITNTSPDHVISFRWIIEGTPAEQVALIEPDHGFLQPGQTKLLKVSFFSCGSPSMYDLDILCEVVDETEMADFNKRLIAWTNDQEERQYTFTITETDGKKNRPRSGPRLKSLANTNQSHSKSEGDLRRYQALPPIGDKEGTGTRAKRRGKSGSVSDRSTPSQPSPPESFWLHLGITARTHSIAEFHKTFPSEINNFMVDQRYVVSQEARQGTEDLSALASCSRPEMDVITDVMSVILRGLLDDGSFHSSLADLGNEPVPYFRQLCESPYIYDRPSSRASSASSERSGTGQDYGDELDQTPVSHTREETPPALSHDERAASKTQEIVQRSGSALSAVDHMKDADLDPEWKAMQRNKARSLPEFESFLEGVIENSLLNILTEASRGEVNLTARPRVIALPPSKLNKTPR